MASRAGFARQQVLSAKSLKGSDGAETMTPLVKHLLRKREDLRLVSRTHITEGNNTGMWRQESLVATGQLTYLNQPPPRPVRETRVKKTWRRAAITAPEVDLYPPCTCVHMRTHTHEHRHTDNEKQYRMPTEPGFT